ncbi:MAG: hypothetical protein ACI9VR_000981 [Cognaticolwellia sp.]|jgi:hypothetical protein
MTPTLVGRWQTRTLLFFIIGVPITLPFCLLAVFLNPLSAPLPLVMLAIILLIGLGMDVVYDRIQQQRWDHDWPVHAQLWAGVAEGGLSFVALFGWCGGFALLNPLFLPLFPIHYLSVWGAIFLVLQGPIQVLLPRWRFRGGEIL